MAVPCPSGRRALGGGTRRTIRVFVGRKRTPLDLDVRLGLWGVPSIGVVTEGDRAGQLVVYNHDVQCWQLVSSIFHAIRQTWHILWKYGQDMTLGEKEAMARAARLARTLNLTVLGLGRSHASVQELRSQTRSAVTEASRALGNPRKPTKVAAKRQLAAISSGSDQRGRANPSVIMTRTVAARDSILARLEREILRIDPQIFRRQRAFIQIVLYTEQVILYAVRDFLLELNGSGLHVVLDRPEVRRMTAQHLRYLAGDLARLDFAPYRAACSYTAQDFREAAEILEHGDLNDEETRRSLFRLFKACESAMVAKAAQLRIERVLYALMRDVSQSRPFNPERYRNTLIDAELDLQRVRDDILREPIGLTPRVHLREATEALLDGKPEQMKEKLKAASAAL